MAPAIQIVIEKILDRAGLLDAMRHPATHELHLALENPPYMRLVIEKIHFDGRPAVSLAHYGEQNGDAMRDPEMVFDLATFEPLYFLNDYMGLEQFVYVPGSNRTQYYPRLRRELRRFQSTWARNLQEQGFTTCDAMRSHTHPKKVSPPAVIYLPGA